jgi:hypothetical protein
VLEAERGFRKLVGYGAMPILIAAPGWALYIDARRIRATASRIAWCAETIREGLAGGGPARTRNAPFPFRDKSPASAGRRRRV